MGNNQDKENAFLRLMLKDRPFLRSVFDTVPSQQGALSVVWADLAGRIGSDEAVTSVEFANLAGAGGARQRQAVKGRAPVPGISPVDILVVCPLAKELYPTLFAFGINPQKPATRNAGRKIFTCELKSSGGQKLRIGLAAIGGPRNTRCAIGTEQLLTLLQPAYAVLCGIGAGVKPKAKKGDVAVSTAVYDIAGGRLQPGSEGRRDDPFPVDRELDRMRDDFENNVQQSWKQIVRNVLAKARSKRQFPVVDSMIAKVTRFEVQGGVMIVGEKLVADGSLPMTAKKRDSRIISCDMEGSGFAQACEDHSGGSVKWIVFRGISDFGDRAKSKAADRVWQPTAALLAAMAVKHFIQMEFD